MTLYTGNKEKGIIEESVSHITREWMRAQNWALSCTLTICLIISNWRKKTYLEILICCLWNMKSFFSGGSLWGTLFWKVYWSLRWVEEGLKPQISVTKAVLRKLLIPPEFCVSAQFWLWIEISTTLTSNDSTQSRRAGLQSMLNIS